jgi:hypothetical protein
MFYWFSSTNCYCLTKFSFLTYSHPSQTQRKNTFWRL